MQFLPRETNSTQLAEAQFENLWSIRDPYDNRIINQEADRLNKSMRVIVIIIKYLLSKINLNIQLRQSHSENITIYLRTLKIHVICTQ